MNAGKRMKDIKNRKQKLSNKEGKGVRHLFIFYTLSLYKSIVFTKGIDQLCYAVYYSGCNVVV